MTTTYFELEKKIGLGLNFKTYGQPKGEAETVLVLHALTGNSDVTGPNGWWNEIVGADKALDLNKFHVVAIDIPGNGANGQFVDDVQQYDSYLIAGIIAEDLKKHDYDQIDIAIGGSLGGGLLWELIVDNPNWIKKAFIIAAHYKTSSWLKGVTYTQDQLLKNSEDPINDARRMAMLFYRSPKGFSTKFKQNHEVTKWLDYHGEALERRFNIRAYRLMNHLLGNINAIEGYKNFEEAFYGVTTEIIQVGIDSDILFPKDDNKETYQKLWKLNIKSFYEEIKSPHGHDAFLIEHEQLENIINKHLN